METIQQAIQQNRIEANGLPLWCFVQNPGSNETVIVDFPKYGYSRLEIPIPWKKARQMNRKMGITEQMEEAMLVGSMFGFHVPAAQVL